MTSLPTTISEFKLPHEEFDPAVARQLAELIQHAYKHIGGTPLDALQETYNISLLGTLTVPFGFVASDISSKKAMYDRNKRRMPDYAHTGTPVYFTIHEAALERHHNLHEVYMLGIGQKQLEL